MRSAVADEEHRREVAQRVVLAEEGGRVEEDGAGDVRGLLGDAREGRQLHSGGRKPMAPAARSVVGYAQARERAILELCVLDPVVW